MTGVYGASPRPEVAAPARAYIPEIQGLRTVAALLVAVYHIWFARVSGGVDAFFVIAAFFMTLSFAKVGLPGGADLLRYWSSTARRVCPGTALVVVATLAGVLFLAPRIIWRESIWHAAYSSVFLENWYLAKIGTDYLSQGLAASPFQQMWALSLQMQFAVVLPVVLVGTTLLARRTGTDVRRAWTAALSALFLVSLAYSVWITARNQPWAYFDSAARFWEYAAGALLALHADRLPRPSRPVLYAIGWGALAVLGGFAAIFPVATLFPGIAALVPVGATAALIWVARAGVPIAPLRWRPVLALGDISFAFYLWHWPILVFWRIQSGRSEVGPVEGLAIIAAAGVLAWVSVRLVETPVRRNARLGAHAGLGLAAGLLALAPTVLATGGFAWVYKSFVGEAEAAHSAVLADPAARPARGRIVPDPIFARRDNAVAYADGCHQSQTEAEVVECVYGVEDGSRLVVLHGGSHSLQWLPALRAVADDLDLRIVSMTKSSCFTFAPPADFELEEPVSCEAWNEASVARIRALAPDAVITVATRGQGTDETVPASVRTRIEGLAAAGIPVLALRDNPWRWRDMASCVDLHRAAPSACDVDRDLVLARDDPGRALTAPGILPLDLSDLYCDDARCWAVRDGLLAYRDAHHITATWAIVHADRLKAALSEILG